MVRLKVMLALLILFQFSACKSQSEEQNKTKAFVLECQLKGVPDGPAYLFKYNVDESGLSYDTIAVGVCKSENVVFEGRIDHFRTYQIGIPNEMESNLIKTVAESIWITPGKQKYIIHKGEPNLVEVLEGKLSKKLYSFQTEEYKKILREALKLNFADKDERIKRVNLTKKLNVIRQDLQAPILEEYQDNPYFKLLKLQQSLDRHRKSKEELFRIKAEYEKLKPQILTSDSDLTGLVETLIGLISRRFNSAIGSQFIEVEGIDREGNAIKLSEVIKKNKYVLLDFWASWCGPCRAEFPYMKSVYPTYHPEGFEIVALTTDKNVKAWQKALDQEDVPWINIFPGDRESADKYGVTGIPANFLIDSNGKIIAKNLRHEKLGEKLKELFIK